MARIRSIKPAFFTSEDMCRCAPLARLLFLGLLTEADKAGRVEDRPWQLKIRLLPNDDCNVDELLWQLADRRLVRRYQAADRQVIQIVNFAKHQKPHPKETESALPQSGLDRVRPELNTASNTQPSEHPVEDPSCPRRNGSGDLNNGSGDLGSGVLVREERTHAVRSAPLIVSPLEYDRRHGKHVSGFCDFVCLPESVFDDYLRRVIAAGSDEGSARASVLTWAKSVKQAWQGSGRIAGSDIFKFWNHEWEATHGSNKPMATGGVDVLAGLR
jgi:hypothetical protein